MITGTVKWFNSQKGYGFIEPQGGTKDVFVHISSVEASGLSTLRDGQRVTFDEKMSRKSNKMEAVNIKLAG